jgi:RNA polymerase sigma-70 factor (ECF subfamily)
VPHSIGRNNPEDWQRYRGYLRALAAAGLNSDLHPKVDPSDVVQQTLLNAVGAIDEFRGTTEAELLAWLRKILARNLGHAVRHFSRERRDIAREQTIHAVIDASSFRMEAMLAAASAAPDNQVHHAEQVVALCEAIEHLPESQREAIDLHHLQGHPISQVAEQMGRSTAAVAGLLKRGLKTLRQRLDHPELP